MSSTAVGIGECRISNDPSEVLVTHALGSCIAILIHDPHAGVAGLLHYMLPESSLDMEKAVDRPFVFADTGIPLLFQAAYQLGALKGRMTVMAVGGAQMMDVGGTFNIGKRNHLAMRKIFWKAGVIVQREEIGGILSRTVSIETGTGRVLLRSPGRVDQYLGNTAERREAPDGIQYSHRG
jgi:chemotaxis protein CheD